MYLTANLQFFAVREHGNNHQGINLKTATNSVTIFTVVKPRNFIWNNFEKQTKCWVGLQLMEQTYKRLNEVLRVESLETHEVLTKRSLCVMQLNLTF